MKFETISSRNLESYIYNSESVLIDLRNRKDYQEMHIKNAINIPYEELNSKYRSLSLNKELILYCNRGGLSLIAAKWLSEQGFKTKIVIGGIHSYKGSNRECQLRNVN